jgi:uncharacterized protein (TIGR03437 family)
VANDLPPAQFTLQQGASAAAPDSAVLTQLSNTGAGFLTATITAAQPWLVFDQSSISVGASSVNVIGQVNPSVAPSAPGVYQSDFTVSGASGQIDTGTVVLTVKPGTLDFEISPPAFLVTTSDPVNNGGQFTITNTGNVAMDFSVSGTGAVPSSGHLNPGGTTHVSATSIPSPGGSLFTNYNVVATAGGTSVTKTFQLVVQAPNIGGFDVSEAPPFQVASAPGTFDMSFIIGNSSSASVPFTVGPTDVANFLSMNATANPASGTVNASGSTTVHVTGAIPNTAGLYAANVIFNVAGIAYTRPIALLSTGYQPIDQMPESRHDFLGRASGTCAASSLLVLPLNPVTGRRLSAGLPALISLVVADNCGKVLTSGSVTATFSSNDTPVALRASAVAGGWSGTWVPADASNPQVTIAITAVDGSGKIKGTANIGTYLTGATAVPQVGSGGVVLASDYSRPLTSAPGQWISIFGSNLAAATVPAAGVPFPTTLSDTAVLFNGKALDLSYASANQINAFVPFGTPVNSTAILQVQRGSAMSVPVEISITTIDPALFLVGPAPVNPGLVVAYRGSSIFTVDAQHPVRPGDTIVLYALGLGPVDTDLVPDRISPLSPLAKVTSPVSVSIGGIRATPDFAGMTPGYVGLYQMNVKVPAGVAAGTQVPIIVTVGSVSSTTVTIPFQIP